ncbi:MAG: sigma-70 family RNA polymerase sigma factor [Chryseolinea sp.]
MSLEQTITLYQPLLHNLAYSIVRSKEDAEDIVQDTIVKWLNLGPKTIENSKAYLIAAVRNNCFTHLIARRNKREELVEQSDELDQTATHEIGFSHLDLQSDTVMAMGVLHARLEPLERAIFLLKEVFDFDYEVLQETFDKKKEHCRQLLCRAKKKLSEETSKINFELPDTSNLIENFRKACDFGHVADLINVLKQDVANSLSK